MSAIRVPLVRSFSVLAIAATASAGQITFQAGVQGLTHGSSASTTVPQFDPALGVLRTAHIEISGSVSGTYGLENTSPSAATVGPTSAYAAASIWWTAGGRHGDQYFPSYSVPTTTFAGHDGVIDFAGTSGTTFAFSGATAPGPQVIDFLFESGFDLLVGNGTVALEVPDVHILSWAQPIFVQNVAVTADAMFTVRYEFDAHPDAICRAAFNAGCPCGNFSGLGLGCRNSTGSSGGLAASGSASLAGDTLTLLGSGMTNSSALYFQGTNHTYAQSVYGDGLRCVNGMVARLGTRTNSAGSSQMPSAGGTPISALGGVNGPGMRYYQALYRDGGSFCTPATWNATNGVSIAWIP